MNSSSWEGGGWSQFIILLSVAELGCLSRTQDPGSDFFYPASRVDKIPDPGSGSASKKLCTFNPKYL
jgi:hypothetical protein